MKDETNIYNSTSILTVNCFNSSANVNSKSKTMCKKGVLMVPVVSTRAPAPLSYFTT